MVMLNKTVSVEYRVPRVTAGERLFRNFYPASDSSDDEHEREGKKLIKKEVLDREKLWDNVFSDETLKGKIN